MDERRIGASEFAVLARIMHVPGELLGDDFDLCRACGRVREMKLRPDALSHHGEADEDDSRDDSPDDFKPVVAVRVESALLFIAGARAVAPDHVTKTDLRGDKGNADHNDRDEKLLVNSWPMLSNSGRKPPTAKEEHHRGKRQQPDNHSKSATHRTSLVISDR